MLVGMSHRTIIFGLSIALVAAACGGADTASNTTSRDTTTTTTAAVETTPTSQPETTTTTEVTGPTLSLSTEGWPELVNGFHYEGWAIVDGSPVTTGKFNVIDGEVVSVDGDPIDVFEVDSVDAASAIVITIEPSGDTDEIPSDTHFLAGDVVDGTADLTVAHPAALGTDFGDADGTFLLATPTDDDDSNELSGIWFLELPGPEPSLDLPTLPAGWIYEGWAIVDGIPLTSGTFLSATGEDNAAPFSGPEPGPAFPGEDYLVNAPDEITLPTDLSGGTVVISVEPSPDDDPAPFVFKPLIGVAAEDATDHESYRFELNDDPLPSGTATLG